MPKRPKAILFDLGGTLLTEKDFDLTRGIEHLLQLAQNPRQITLQELVERAGAIGAALLPRRIESKLEVSVMAFQRLLFEPLGITFQQSYPALALEYWRASVRMCPEPQLAETLRALTVPLAVVSNATNSGDILSWELAQHQLLHHFSFVMSSSDYGLRKPDPLFLQAAAERLDIAPEELWFIGDSLDFDVAGALAARMTAVWYNPLQRSNNTPHAPHHELQRWGQLLEVLAR